MFTLLVLLPRIVLVTGNIHLLHISTIGVLPAVLLGNLLPLHLLGASDGIAVVHLRRQTQQPLAIHTRHAHTRNIDGFFADQSCTVSLTSKMVSSQKLTNPNSLVFCVFISTTRRNSRRDAYRTNTQQQKQMTHVMQQKVCPSIVSLHQLSRRGIGLQVQ